MLADVANGNDHNDKVDAVGNQGWQASGLERIRIRSSALPSRTVGPGPAAVP